MIVRWVHIVFIIGMLLGSTANADSHLHLISDVDDTIQLTQIRMHGHYLQFLVNQFKSHDSFIGMPTLYQILASRLE